VPSTDVISNRYKKMATRLGIKTHIHALRHGWSTWARRWRGYDARVYAAWVAAADRKAAEILGSRMPKRK
jgi:integrase